MNEKQEQTLIDAEDSIKQIMTQIYKFNETQPLPTIGARIKAAETKRLSDELEGLTDEETFDFSAWAAECADYGSTAYLAGGALACVAQIAKPTLYHSKTLNRTLGIVWSTYEFIGCLVYAYDFFSKAGAATYNRAKKEGEIIRWTIASGVSLAENIAWLAAKGALKAIFYPLLVINQTFESWQYFYDLTNKYAKLQKKLNNPVSFLKDRIKRYKDYSRKIEGLELKNSKTDEDNILLNRLKSKQARLEVQIKAYSRVHYECITNDKNKAKVESFLNNEYCKNIFNEIKANPAPTAVEKKLVENLRIAQERKVRDAGIGALDNLAQAVGWTLLVAGLICHPLLIVGAVILSLVAAKKIWELGEAVACLLHKNETSSIIPVEYKAENKNRLEKFPPSLSDIGMKEDEKFKYLMAYDLSCVRNKKSFDEEKCYKALNDIDPDKRQKVLDGALEEYLEKESLKKQLGCKSLKKLEKLNLSRKDIDGFLSNNKAPTSSWMLPISFFSTPKTAKESVSSDIFTKGMLMFQR